MSKYYETIACLLKWKNGIARYNDFDITILAWGEPRLSKNGKFIRDIFPPDYASMICYLWRDAILTDPLDWHPRTGYGFKSLANLLARLDKISLDKVSPNALD